MTLVALPHDVSKLRQRQHGRLFNKRNSERASTSKKHIQQAMHFDAEERKERVGHNTPCGLCVSLSHFLVHPYPLTTMDTMARSGKGGHRSWTTRANPEVSPSKRKFVPECSQAAKDVHQNDARARPGAVPSTVRPVRHTAAQGATATPSHESQSTAPGRCRLPRLFIKEAAQEELSSNVVRRAGPGLAADGDTAARRFGKDLARGVNGAGVCRADFREGQEVCQGLGVVVGG